MTNPISSDKNSTLPLPKEQKSVARDSTGDGKPAQHQAVAGQETTDVARANERLAMENRPELDTTIRSGDEARQRVAALKQLIAGNPQAALAAHGGAGFNGVEAVLRG